MDEEVPHAAERGVAAAGEPGAEPGKERQGEVMDDVEERHLAVLLAHDKDKRVEKVDKLADVVPPRDP